MKKIIFDLDNTLIKFDATYFLDYGKVLNGNYKDGERLYKIIGEYENLNKIYDKEDLICFINSKMNTNYNISLINSLNDIISNNWIYKLPDKLEDVLSYLYQKYELYVLTNWFTDCQEKRLENANILKYFKEVVGNDKYLSKPNKDGYLYIIGNTKKEDVIMIGDSINIDIKGAKEVGINYILCDYDDKYKFKNKIKSIIKLKEML